MPLYDFICQTCDKKSLDEFVDHITTELPCTCGGIMKRQLATPNVKTDFFTLGKGQWIYDIPGGPQLITSKEQLKKICDEKGVVAEALKAQDSQTGKVYNKI